MKIPKFTEIQVSYSQKDQSEKYLFWSVAALFECDQRKSVFNQVLTYMRWALQLKHPISDQLIYLIY